MICPKCYGTGKDLSALDVGSFGMTWPPCHECHGSGIVSCCDAAGAGIAEGGEASEKREGRSD